MFDQLHTHHDPWRDKLTNMDTRTARMVGPALVYWMSLQNRDAPVIIRTILASPKASKIDGFTNTTVCYTHSYSGTAVKDRLTEDIYMYF